MLNPVPVKLPWTTTPNISSTDVFYPVSDWTTALGLTSIRAAIMELRSRYGNALVVPAYQTCNDEDSPDAAVAIPVENDPAGGYASTEGIYYPNSSSDTTPVVAGKNKIRFGFMVKLASGSNGSARVRAQLYLVYGT